MAQIRCEIEDDPRLRQGTAPTKVVRVALENAVSVASVLLLIEATMAEIPVAKHSPAAQSEARGERQSNGCQ